MILKPKMLIVWGTRTGMITHANTCQHFHITKTWCINCGTALTRTWYCSGLLQGLWLQMIGISFCEIGVINKAPHQKIKKNLANQTSHKEPNLGRLPELFVSTSCREVDRCWWCINYISDQNMCIYLWTCLWLGINSMCMHLNHTKAPVNYPASKQMIITRRVCEEVLKTSFLFSKQSL